MNQTEIEWFSNIHKVSDPIQVMLNAKQYLGPDTIFLPSDKPSKKYKVYNPNTKKFIYFGSMMYEDFTKHKDEKRKMNYLKRSSNIKGNWKEDKYSPNNLSREILWK